jgi:hypothetical protein
MLAHQQNGASPAETVHETARTVTPVWLDRMFTLTERPDVVAERIARKSRVRAALAQAGCTKQLWIAAVLGVSRQYVSRCLSDNHRAELSAAHLAKLGVGL